MLRYAIARVPSIRENANVASSLDAVCETHDARCAIYVLRVIENGIDLVPIFRVDISGNWFWIDDALSLERVCQPRRNFSEQRISAV
jgi:hypothetical protein